MSSSQGVRAGAALAAGLCLSSAAPAAAATIRTEVRIAAPAAQVWAAVRDVGAVDRRLARGFVTAASVAADVRTVTFANGLTVKERIVSIDDDLRRFAYGAVESRATFHAASIEVVEDGAGARLIWITDILPVEFKPMVAANMTAGAAAMKATLEADARGGGR
jgi:hypothetical protein